MKTREEAEALINEQMYDFREEPGGHLDDAKIFKQERYKIGEDNEPHGWRLAPAHYGRLELKELLNFIYGEQR
jgi:hypothetical protein